MNEITLTKMKQMKLYGMHGTFKTAIETGKTDDYTLDQFVSMLIETEWDDRNEWKRPRRIRFALPRGRIAPGKVPPGLRNDFHCAAGRHHRRPGRGQG